MSAHVQFLKLRQNHPHDDAVAATVACLRSGGLVLAPTDTTYGLLADAEQAASYLRVFEIKGRALDQPVPYLLADLAQVEAFLAAGLPPPAHAAAARFWPGALTLVVNATEAVAPHLIDTRGTVAVRVPDSPFVRAVANGVGGPLTGTSANRSGQPPATTAHEAEGQLGTMVDCVVDGGVAMGTPSTIIDTSRSPWRVLRAGPVTATQVAHAAGVPVEET